MILSSVFHVLLLLIKGCLENLDFSAVSLPSWSFYFFNLLAKALAFFPFEIWSVIISNILMWVSIHFIWAIIEWIYIKIPGVS